MPARLDLSARAFAILRAIAGDGDPRDAHLGRSATASTVKALQARRLITYTNVVSHPWQITKDGVELLRLKKLGEERAEQRARASYRGAGR